MIPPSLVDSSASAERYSIQDKPQGQVEHQVVTLKEPPYTRVLLTPIRVLSGFIVVCLAHWEHDRLLGDETENPVYNESIQREGQRSLPILSATAITSLSGVEPRIIAGQTNWAALIYEGILRLLTMDLSPEGTTGGAPGEGE